MQEVLFSESVVAAKLPVMKLNKSLGPDMLHPRVLFETRKVICSPLTNLFNESMNQGIVPDAWKNSIVTVVHKKGKRDCVDNYRPISLTCICCKIMESVISDHVMKYFLENKIFSNRQYGFIKTDQQYCNFLMQQTIGQNS